jgi:hypothetical protein
VEPGNADCEQGTPPADEPECENNDDCGGEDFFCAIDGYCRKVIIVD